MKEQEIKKEKRIIRMDDKRYRLIDRIDYNYPNLLNKIAFWLSLIALFNSFLTFFIRMGFFR